MLVLVPKEFNDVGGNNNILVPHLPLLLSGTDRPSPRGCPRVRIVNCDLLCYGPMMVTLATCVVMEVASREHISAGYGRNDAYYSEQPKVLLPAWS